MANPNVRVQTSKQLTADYNRAKVFIGEKSTFVGDYINSDYADEDLLAGTVMARVGATNKLVKCDSTLTNGGQFPIGVLLGDVTVEGGETVELTVANGEVNGGMLIFNDAETADTVVSSRTLRDHLLLAGTKIREVDYLNEFDN